MNFDEIVVKESPGLCRCCLSEGCYKDLSTEYTWMNETEVYADMLLECFDISISQHNGGPNGGNRLICEVCITRLRDACNFKKQVLDSEKKFVDLLARGEFQPKVIMYQATMKAEELLEESIVEDAEVEYLDEGMDYEDDLPLKQPEAVTEASVSDVTVESLKVKGKRGRPRKTTSVVKTDKRKVPKIEEKPRTSKTMTKERTATDLRRFLSLLLENSTAMPFRWYSNKFMCFYCCSEFVESSQLINHTRTEHEDAKLFTLLKNIKKDHRVKFDVTNISCKKCSKPVKDLNDFINHALNEHNIVMDTEYNKYLYAFKLSDNKRDGMKCLDCSLQFRFFGPLLTHNYKCHSDTNTFLCEICGQGFQSKGYLESHIKYSHPASLNHCKKCGKRFPTTDALKLHYKNHSLKLKCPKCPEVLSTAYKRKRHLVTAHGVKSFLFTCEDCSLQFIEKNKLVNHIQKVHLKLKLITCDICGFKVYDKANLNRHLVCHSEERPFECQYCKKTFQREQTRKIHVRIHEDDKRYACKECGKAFVQVASLKLHARSHHMK